ncbi:MULTISPECIES: HNH endonuclease [unclassified Stenotrophomonas]|uniref:HNH endonuclease n=1 Tax=unclassified Stenotrophomonas TaxID=196198 RepID=UPI003BF8A602
MIAITRTRAPEILSDEYVAAGTARFIESGHPVWNVEKIKIALHEMSRGKCAYCEIRLNEGATYLEVEHFFAKKHHPERVLDWNNLLPACKRCNSSKGDWDVSLADQMAIDPTIMDPKVHIRYDEAYRPVALSPEGEVAIVEIGLDDIRLLGVMRYTLGETFKRKLEEIRGSYLRIPALAPVRERRSLIRKVKKALELCQSDQPFSSIASTVLERSAAYAELKAEMVAACDWDEYLEALETAAKRSSLA